MKRRVLQSLLAALLSTGVAWGDAIVTYESYDDATPDDPGIHLCFGCSATIEVWLTPTDGHATTLLNAGFEYEGDAMSGVLTNGGIVLRDHRWDDVFLLCIMIHDLPNPGLACLFNDFALIPIEGRVIATMTVTGTGQGAWLQYANPIYFADMGVNPISLAPESERFVVFVGPANCEDPDPDHDCNRNGIHDVCDILNGDAEDCNSTGTPDACDLLDGTSGDCNDNAILDECETEDDCNGNDRPDECDLADGLSDDCNNNAVPDECETEDDCNDNDRPDECDLTDGSSEDCNDNAVPDECETDNDCNSNARPDDCDIEEGTSDDCNANTVPDECDLASGASSDDNIDGIPDECPLALGLMAGLTCAGATGTGVEPGCAIYDMDHDDDVDWADLGLLQIAHGGCGVLIFSDPRDHQTCAGDSVVFEVRAGGVLLSYQWRHNGEDIPGATDSTLVFDEPEVGDTGLYDCRVTSACGGMTTSNMAEFIVSNAPAEFTIQPKGATVCEGDNYFMVASATGFPLYQWFKDGEPIAGVTTPYFAIVNASAQDAGVYYVAASNSCNDTASDDAVVAVIDCMRP